MKQGLALRGSQHLALTPQLQQSIRLLQLSTLELQQEVEQMLDDNPFLDRDTEAAEREAYGVEHADSPYADISPASASDPSASEPLDGATYTQDADTSAPFEDSGQSWEGDGSVEFSPDDSEWGGDALPRGAADEDGRADAVQLARQQVSLQDHLHAQIGGLKLSEGDRAALKFLIESLNDEGYLEDTLESLAQSLAPADLAEQEEVLAHFQVALKMLQSLEPTGVGARHLGECLALQLQSQLRGHSQQGHQPDVPLLQIYRLALRMCQHPMDLLARRDTRRLAQLCGAIEAEVREALVLISHLEPKPGRRFVDVERQVVVPDVLVVRSGPVQRPQFKVQLNPDVMPRLRVHDVYANALKGYKASGNDASNFAALQQRLQEARWFIRNIQQRFDTIVRVSNAIVERQYNFFVHGELAMRPLVLREIADELGLHESTISRVTTAKYMSTPYGTFELKYFFGSGLGTESGGNASSTAVRALIRQLVAAESPNKPLSDSQISDMLKEQGIECARRTVAKYREGLKIAPATLRKAL
jgi:RNA polymerase sigma-54 factor